LTTASKRKTRKRKLQVADCEQSELNSKWIKEFKSEYVRSCALIMMGGWSQLMIVADQTPGIAWGKAPKTRGD